MGGGPDPAHPSQRPGPLTWPPDEQGITLHPSRRLPDWYKVLIGTIWWSKYYDERHTGTPNLGLGVTEGFLEEAAFNRKSKNEHKMLMQREESVCGRGNSICKGLAESKRPWGTETLTEHAYLGWKMGAGLSQKRPTREEVLCSIFLISSHCVCPIWTRMQKRQPAQDSASSLFPASIIPHSSWLRA